MAGNKKVVLLTSVIVTAIFVLLVVLVIQFVKIGNLRRKENDLTSSYNSLTGRIRDYENQLPDLEDRDNFLAQYAHEHNWGKAGDKWYVTD